MTSYRPGVVYRVRCVGAALSLLLPMLPACAARHVRGFSSRVDPNTLGLTVILDPAGIRRMPPDVVLVNFAVATDPPGAQVLVNGDSVGIAPAQVHHWRGLDYRIPRRMVVQALPQNSALCAQTRVFDFSVPVADTVRLDLHQCPSPDQDLSRVFTEDEVEARPELLRTPAPTNRMLESGAGGAVVFQVVVDSSGRAEPRSFSRLTATDNRLVAKARAAALASTYRPGRILGHPVRVRTSLIALFFVVR